MNAAFQIRSCLVALVVAMGAVHPASRVAAQDTARTSLQLPLTLEADHRTELRARVEGYVAEVHGDIGDRVVEGQLLVTLDAPELEVDVLRRRQMVMQAQSNLGVAKGRVATAQARLRQAESARAEQAALRQLRASERDRYAALVSNGAVQKERLEEAEYHVLAVDAAVEKIEANVTAARADILAAESEVDFASAGIEVAKTELAHAVAQDQLRQIKAPFSGLITDRNVDPGQLVSPGNVAGKPLLVIENVDVLRGVMTVPADDAGLISVGATVQLIGFEGGDGVKSPKDGELKVSRVSQSLAMRTRTMRVEIDLKNPYDEKKGRYQFLSGQYGSARVTVR